MDKGASLDSSKILNYFFFKTTFMLALLAQPTFATTPQTKSLNTPRWKTSLKRKLSALEETNPQQFGLYVKNLTTGEELSFHGEERWYLASGVKVPVALEVLQQIEQGKFNLESQIKLKDSDYIDGAGETNLKKPGTSVSVLFLLEQMLINSDNTASDLLIGLVNLDRVNTKVNELVPGGFTPITTLSDVRRYAYASFHPRATQLKNHDFIALKQIKNEKIKIQKLAHLLGVAPTRFSYQKLDQAYAAYYARQFNSASLRSYGQLLESIIRGEALSKESTQTLLDILARVKTGENRIKAGLPGSIVFAHKTGTQHARTCDFGLAWNKQFPNSPRFVITACTQGLHSTQSAEKLLKKLGEAITDSGALSPSS